MRKQKTILAMAFGVLLALGVSGSLVVMATESPESTKSAEPPSPSSETGAPAAGGGSPWGANYFPNVPLTTHEGKTVHFFEDLIKDKVVMINFIYTSCPDSCPLETARLAQVTEILGDRVGNDVFIYPISIDPERDTPEVLAQYRQRYRAGPGWVFLTGKEADITLLRKKLGLYIAEIQDDSSNNHNLSLIIGNQTTGRWMKRSPFENPYVLATHVGSWLSDWKLPSQQGGNDFANAPKLRAVSDGERLFRTRCAACHTIGGHTIGGAVATDPNAVGPDLLGVTHSRDPQWLARWIAEPDKMLEERDPLAMALYAQYDNVPMPNMRLNREDVDALIEFLESENTRLGESPPDLSRDGLTIRNAWIREAHPEAVVNAGYMTLANTGFDDMVLVEVKSEAFEKIELHEMTMTGGTMGMRALASLNIPAGGEVQFKRGGKHLMMHDPGQSLRRGQKVSLTLVFQSGEDWTIAVPVREEAR